MNSSRASLTFLLIALAVSVWILAWNGVEARSPRLTLVLTAVAVLATLVGVYRLPHKLEAAPHPSHVPLIAVLVGSLGYALVASVYAINHHHHLGMTGYDLAIYDNIFYHTIHGKLLGTSLTSSGYHASHHFDPILVLLSPLYVIYPRAELLLALQSFWLASAAIPLYLIARHHIGNAWYAAALGLAILLYPGLHGANFFDFHTLALIAPLLLWALYFLDTRRYVGYWVMLGLLLMVREDVPLMLCAVGIYALLSGHPKRIGIVTIAVSLAYFGGAMWLIRHVGGEQRESYTYYYRDLIPEGSGWEGILITLVTKPILVIQHVFSTPKLLYFARLFAPVLFLPFFAPRGKILLAYGLIVLLTASRPAMFSLHFQYSTVIYPSIFFLTALTLGGLSTHRIVQRFRLEPLRLRRALLAGVLLSSVLVSVKYGALVPNATFTSGASRFMPYPTNEGRADYRWVTDTIRRIPQEASVSASIYMMPHVSNRDSIFHFPEGWGSDYLFLHRSRIRPWRSTNLERLETSGAYEIVTERGDLALLKRRESVPLPDPVPERSP